MDNFELLNICNSKLNKLNRQLKGEKQFYYDSEFKHTDKINKQQKNRRIGRNYKRYGRI
jgi:hypothetical protein